MDCLRSVPWRLTRRFLPDGAYLGLLAVVAGMVTLGAARTAHAQAVVAHVESPPARWPACGILHVLGEVVLVVDRAPTGTLATGQRILGVFSCPGDLAAHGSLRPGTVLDLTLSTHRPWQTGGVYPPRNPEHLPRYYVVSVRLDAPVGRHLH